MESAAFNCFEGILVILKDVRGVRGVRRLFRDSVDDSAVPLAQILVRAERELRYCLEAGRCTPRATTRAKDVLREMHLRLARIHAQECPPADPRNARRRTATGGWRNRP